MLVLQWGVWIAAAQPVGLDGEEIERVSSADAEGRWPAFVHVDPAEREQVAQELDALGLEVSRRASGRPRGPSGTLVVRGRVGALQRAERQGHRIQVARRADPRLLPPPLRETAQEVEARALQLPGSWRGEALGAGMVIGNIDGSIDIFHPHFFRADAGAFAWVDQDGDGEFTPGEDAVDLNGDGAIGNNERLFVLDALTERLDRLTFEVVREGDDGELDPSRDWLYLDRNANGARDFGNLDRRAFGEPLFVPDDANGNGRLDPEERILRLGTSVIRAIWTPVEVLRPEDFEDYVLHDGDGSHATAVSGILLGGQLPLQRPEAGLAPEAELVLMDRYHWAVSYADFVDFLDWSEEEGVDVMLHEYAAWTDVAMDGNHPIEQLLAEQVDRDAMVHVCPAGNLADAGKHSVETVENGTATFDVNLVDPLFVSVFWFQQHVPDEVDAVSCELVAPEFTFPVAFDSEILPVVETETSIWSYVEDVPGPKKLFTVSVFDDDRLPSGTYRFVCTYDGEVGEPIHAYLNDFFGWSRGATFEREVQANTMGMPSTHPSCLAVAAHAGRFPDPSVERGELRSWSSRGPRPDGMRTLDLSAPDDPFAPGTSVDYDHGSFRRFGGTSGAAPHVAGVAALMRQAEPELTAHEIRERLLDAVEPHGGDIDHGGLGKLRGWGALYEGEAPVVNVEAAPVTVRAVREGRGDQCTVRLYGSLDPYRSATYRWDVDYDGTWDTDWGGSFLVETPIDGVVRVDAASHGVRVAGVAQSMTVDPVELCSRRCGCASPLEPSSVVVAGLLALVTVRRRRSSGA